MATIDARCGRTPLETSPGARETDHTPQNVGWGLYGRTPPATGGLLAGLTTPTLRLRWGAPARTDDTTHTWLATRVRSALAAEQSHTAKMAGSRDGTLPVC